MYSASEVQSEDVTSSQSTSRFDFDIKIIIRLLGRVDGCVDGRVDGVHLY